MSENPRTIRSMVERIVIDKFKTKLGLMRYEIIELRKEVQNLKANYFDIKKKIRKKGGRIYEQSKKAEGT